MDMIEYAEKFIGTKYEWGGNTPEQGLDCSGFVQEVLRSIYNYRGDRTCNGIYDYLLQTRELYCEVERDITKFEKEDIVFYGEGPGKFIHISIMNSSFTVLESGGEGRVSTDKGFVRQRNIKHRDDVWGAIRIFGNA